MNAPADLPEDDDGRERGDEDRDDFDEAEELAQMIGWDAKPIVIDFDSIPF